VGVVPTPPNFGNVLGEIDVSLPWPCYRPYLVLKSDRLDDEHMSRAVRITRCRSNGLRRFFLMNAFYASLPCCLIGSIDWLARPDIRARAIGVSTVWSMQGNGTARIVHNVMLGFVIRCYWTGPAVDARAVLVWRE